MRNRCMVPAVLEVKRRFLLTVLLESTTIRSRYSTAVFAPLHLALGDSYEKHSGFDSGTRLFQCGCGCSGCAKGSSGGDENAGISFRGVEAGYCRPGYATSSSAGQQESSVCAN